MTRLLKTGEISEFTIQEMIVQYLNLKGYGDWIIQIYNEGAGRANRGALAYRTGLRKGASDLFIAVPSQSFHGLWLEVKSKDGKLSFHQMEFFRDVEKQNYMTFAAWSFDEAKDFLDWYLSS